MEALELAVAAVPDAPGLGLALAGAQIRLMLAGEDITVLQARRQALEVSMDPVVVAERSIHAGDVGVRAGALDALMAGLGGGFAGRSLGDPVRTAQLVALAGILGDRLPPMPDWPIRLGQAAEYVRRRLLVHHGHDPRVLAWLQVLPE